MKNNCIRVAVLAIAAVVVWGALAGPVQAQGFNRMGVMSNYSPQMYIAPGLTVNQYAYNAQLARLYAITPPYAYGYNPYPRTIVNYYGPVSPYYPTPPYPYYRPYPVVPNSLYYNYSAYPYYLR